MDTHQDIAAILVKWYGDHNVDARMVKQIAEISSKAGTREAVEWLIKHSWDGSLQHWSDGGDVQCVAMEDWQAKLKEWGIK